MKNSFSLGLFLGLSSLVVSSSWAQIVFPGQIPTSDGFSASCTTNKQQPGVCKPLPECLVIYTQLADLQEQPCLLANGQRGVCCPASGSQSSGVSPIGTLFFRPPNVKIPNLTAQDFRKAAEAALQVFQQRGQLEQQLFVSKIVIQRGTPAAFHLDFFQTTPQALSLGGNAIRGVETSVQLVQQNQLTPDQGRFALPFFSAVSTPVEDTCPPTAVCTDFNSPYRTMDGSCNNRRHPDWAKANTALQRIIPPKYGDGVNSPRLGEDGRPLPSSRTVSSQLTMSSSSFSQSDVTTLLVMQWGQFLDHDLTHTPIIRGRNSSGVTCCSSGQIIEKQLRHPDCFPIEIPQGDAFYGQFNQRCMEFVRSLPAVRPQCKFGPREQMNQVSGFLDGSAIYGSSESESRELRELAGGRLLTQRTRNGRILLPIKSDECADFATQRFCFKAGDSRVNEQPQLAAVHTIWVREHNRIAGILQQLNPHWNDEQLFQETRKIVAAELQHITYNEFLPILLGDTYMETFKLNPLPSGSGYTQLYDENINPSITNEFATAAFRMGHSLVQGILEGFGAFGDQTKSMLLHQHQFKPFELYEPEGLDSLVRGLVMQPAQKLDRAFSDELKNRLFQGKAGFGMDLIALNIQRGRDHGIPPYNDYRELCGKPRARRWEDLADTMDQDVITVMSRIYSNIDDVDLYIGGVSERPVTGAMLGPTFLCLIGDQMARLRRGDRYFYEEATNFTPGQLDALRQVSLARVLCDNSDNMKSIQRNAFLRSNFQNKRFPCDGSSIPSLDLTPWKQ